VIEHGRTGIIVDDYREMAAALEQADALDPLDLRHAVRERFSPERLVADYVNAYRAAIVRRFSSRRRATSASSTWSNEWYHTPTARNAESG
jgi:hypothetical protein